MDRTSETEPRALLFTANATIREISIEDIWTGGRVGERDIGVRAKKIGRVASQSYRLESGLPVEEVKF